MGQCDVESSCVAVRFVGTDCTLKNAIAAGGTRDGTGISGRKCDLVTRCATTSILTWTEDLAVDTGGFAGFTLYDADWNVIGTKAIEATTGSDSVTATGEVHKIVFESHNVDTWTVTIGLTQDGVQMNTVFVCVDCHVSSSSVALAGISVGDDSETGTTMTDSSASAGCAGSCIFLRTSNPCSSANGGCDENAICADLGGTPSCQCRAGYTGDGSTCTEDNRKCMHSADIVGARTSGKTVEECRTICTGSDVFAMECPTGSDQASCICLDFETYDQYSPHYTTLIIPSGNCQGQPELSTDITSGSNGPCGGPYVDGNGESLGGQDRAMLRHVNPCTPSYDGCDPNASCTNDNGTPDCTCNAGFADITGVASDGLTCSGMLYMFIERLTLTSCYLSCGCHGSFMGWFQWKWCIWNKDV